MKQNVSLILSIVTHAQEVNTAILMRMDVFALKTNTGMIFPVLVTKGGI